MRNFFLIAWMGWSALIQIGHCERISHQKWDHLLGKFVSPEGRVDYKSFKAKEILLDSYLSLLAKNSPDEKSWTRIEQLAYWINAYNAFTIKLVLKYYPIKSIKDIGGVIQIPMINTPWDVRFIQIGEERLTLNDIEHQKIRKVFHEPRIHFCIVCASKSCPPLRNEAYQPDSLELQLEDQAKRFLTDSFRNHISQNSLQLSKIFDWYSDDFPKGKYFYTFLNRYLVQKIENSTKIVYLDYDWSLNE